jgi:hypothetical protein
VKYMPAGYDARIHILRWYDTAFSGDAFPDPAAAGPGGSN